MDFFLVALSFAIVGLGIETTKFGINIAIDIFEILAWIFLFFSGLIGLKIIDITVKKLDEMKWLIIWKDDDEKKEEYEERFKKADELLGWQLELIKYRNRFFLIGIVLIAFSRMALPLKNVICRLY